MILTPRKTSKLWWRIASLGKTPKFVIRILHYHKDFSFGGFEMKNFFFAVIPSWWFQVCFIFTPNLGEDEPTLMSDMFSHGLVFQNRQPDCRRINFSNDKQKLKRSLPKSWGNPIGELSLWHGSPSPTVTVPAVVINLRIDENPWTHP